jgi:hypothetical protein
MEGPEPVKKIQMVLAQDMGASNSSQLAILAQVSRGSISFSE